MKAASAPGDRAVRKIRVRAILFLMLALVAGAGAVLLIKNYLDRMGSGAAARVQTVQVVVAKVDIPIGTPLTKEHLAVTGWPQQTVPPGTFTNVELVEGRTIQQALVQGEPVLLSRLADEKAGTGLTALLAKGTRAMAVRVDQVVGVAGFVKPGDYVDVIVTMSPDEETRKEIFDKAARVSKIILQNIKVLAVGAHMMTKGNKPVKVSVVTLEVNPDQSERLALASKHGVIQLTMRSRIDQDDVATTGVTPLALLQPDEGMEDAEGKKEEKKLTQEELTTLAWIKARRKRARSRRRRSRSAAAKKEEKPAAPVVEVLRGDKIEERKLRPTADSKKPSTITP
jgi:pilus assembly protein CpaB